MGIALLLVCALAAVACSNTPSPAKPVEVKKSADPATPAETGDTAKPGNEVATPDGTKPLSTIHEIAPGGECTDPGPAHAADIEAASRARIPLKVGLTLSHIWKAAADDYEHECLSQVSQIDALGFRTSNSCPVGPKREPTHWTRRICWTDFFDSYLYLTGDAEKYPETFVGALQSNLSVASFTALKKNSPARHRYLGLYDPDPRFFDTDIDGTLVPDSASTFKIIINDKLVEVPTIEANYVKQDIIRVKVLDDPHFPLMLDYYIPSLRKFFITITKASFPTDHDLEQHLAVDKHADVYGIYFDFALDTLRPESEPVLREIADAMKAHPDWTLTINGHTDNIGGNESNLDLSRRRAATVRKALMDRFMIDGARLSTNGFGASQPKDTNDTDRGRAQNRRLELVSR